MKSVMLSMLAVLGMAVLFACYVAVIWAVWLTGWPIGMKVLVTALEVFPGSCVLLGLAVEAEKERK